MLDNVPILLAEDDENDVALMGRAFKRASVPNPVFVVNNGQEVVDYLAGKGKYSDRKAYPMPRLLLLDLKMPWMDGFDVLAWLRGQTKFNALPVVVLTSSKLQKDIDRSRELGVYDYRVKPQSFDDLVRLVDDVRGCWLDEQFNHYRA
ncbi:MAG TPA: response regulator [Candidatus Acidoferrum sp.]|nr:response regulator [Candidatus Acidoferrum sp.]